MAKYIERDAFITWLKKIPLVDLSDGRGLCRVIMEDDFKKAIKNMPESIIHDSEAFVRCRDCAKDGLPSCPIFAIEHQYLSSITHDPDFFCGVGERK